MRASDGIPIWILIYGALMALLTLGFGTSFYLDSDPTVSGDPNFFLGNRNVATFAILAIGVVSRRPMVLFAGLLARFVADIGDMINSFAAGEIVAGLSFLPIVILPAGYACWVLWTRFGPATETPPAS
ncbi:MAG: hypothetical protein AAGD35_20885 [Actinomycetota bacterium]